MVNVNFDEPKQINDSQHISFSFTTPSLNDLLDFSINLIDNSNHPIEFNPSNALFSLKSPKMCQSFQCTGLLRSSKLVHVDAKNLVLFTQNLEQNRVSLLPASKMHRKWLKNCKNQTMVEKRKYTYFAA